ncbi:TPA: linear amide C-N hydrolase, partial [Vibrio campbellii]|nr:linear amide C-N hydrolase [Vibrio campbellii]
HIPDLPSATQWTSVIDQGNKALYYTTMHDSRIKKVDLTKIDFDQKQEVKRELDNGTFTFTDVTP